MHIHSIWTESYLVPSLVPVIEHSDKLRKSCTVSPSKNSQSVREREEAAEEGMPLELSLAGKVEVCQGEERRNDFPRSRTIFSKIQKCKISL